MILQFDINNLDISCTSTESVINDSSNFVKAVFNFQGEIWNNDNINTAIFHQNDKSYSAILDGNWCYIPFEVLKHGGFTVGIMSKYNDNGTVTTVCTRPCFISTNLSCYSDKFEKPITPSQYEQIIELLKSGGGGNIETIKVNGETLTVTDKSVNIPVPKNTSDLVNDSNFVNLSMLNESQSYKVDKIEGKGLSSNDYTDEDKEKVNNIPTKTSELQNDSGFTKTLHFTNVIVSSDSFIDDTILEGYPLKADIPLENVTETDYANVVFSIADVQSMNFAPICTTSNGVVTIYAKGVPQSDITIPLIEVVKI